MAAFLMICGVSFSSVFSNYALAAAALSNLSLSDLQKLLNSQTNTGNGVTGASSAGSAGNLLNKQQGPTVKLTFEGGTRDGDKVTARAFPGGFTNASDPNGLYFTWFLKRDGCDLTDEDDPTGKKGKKESDQAKIDRCDFDGDDIITVNDWKIDAARQIIKGNFDKSSADYSSAANKNFDDKAAGVKALPSLSDWPKTYDNDKDNGTGSDVPNCYVQEPESGLIYELRKTKSEFNNTCPSGYHESCINDTSAPCDVLNSSYDPANPNTVKSIQQNFSVCAVSSEVGGSNGSGGTASESDVYKCDIASSADLKDYKASLECKNNGGIPFCVKDEINTNVNKSWSGFKDASENVLSGTSKIFAFNTVSTTDSTANDASGSTNGVCGQIRALNTNSCSGPLDQSDTCKKSPPPYFLDDSKSSNLLLVKADQSCSTISNNLLNGVTDSSGSTIFQGNSALQPTCSFERDANECKHLFPILPKSIELKEQDLNGNQKNVNLDLNGDKTGDDKFTLAEKEFWGADPTTTQTNGKQLDGAAVSGLGVDSLTWTYKNGDKIGVVVEGDTQIPTQHSNSSYMRMWAFSKGVCPKMHDELEDSASTIDPNSGRGFYIDDNGNTKAGILTANFDLDKCLRDNLQEPDESGANDFSLNLSASPDTNLTNDPSGSMRGDEVSMTATPANTVDPATLNYDWKIERSLDGSLQPGDNTAWQDITSDIQDKIDHSNLFGIGINTFTFRLNIPTDIIDPKKEKKNNFYLRVKVKASETNNSGNQAATATKILAVNQQKDKIVVYPVNADSNGMLNIDSSAKPFCSDANGLRSCPVTKNEIIGIKIPNDGSLSAFSWKINGNDFQCDASISSDCKNAADNMLFFPVLGNENEAVDVEASAVRHNSDTNMDDHITLSRHFLIVAPSVQIVSADDTLVWPKLNGYYKDLDGNMTPDYSSTVYNSSPGNQMNLQAQFLPAWKESQADFDWTVDGVVQSASHNQPNLVVPVTKGVGDSYSVGLDVKYNSGATDQLNNLRKALLKNWGVSPTDTIETSDNANIQIDVVSANGTNGASPFIPWSASLVSHLPEQLMFLMRIALTAFLLLVVTGMIFAIIPETPFGNKEDSRYN